MLDFLKSVQDFYMNSWAYRILLTIPFTVASIENSFPKLKLIKSYISSTMSQERQLLWNIDFERLVNDFKEKKEENLCFRIIIQFVDLFSFKLQLCLLL